MSPTEVEDDPRIRLRRLLVRGSGLEGYVQEAITEAKLSWSTTQVTELALTVADPGFKVWKRAVFEKGSSLIYREPGYGDLRLRVASLTPGPGPSGRGGFTVKARSEGVHKLKQRRGPMVMKKRSPSQFVEAECKAVGMTAVVQPSPSRPRVQRDVPKKGQDFQGAGRPSSWTTFLRLASELGYVCFEFRDTVYFGKPTWLVERDEEPLIVALPLAGAPARYVARNIPIIADSEDATVPVEISDIVIEKNRLLEAHPGGGMLLRGLPPYNDDTYLLTSLTMNLLGPDGLEITAGTPKNPPKQPPSKPGGGGDDDFDDSTAGDGSLPATTGTKSALDFVTMAITASNAAYSFGAEASVSDASPGALDCSELIQWALGRVGVPFVDGSASQIAACVPISVSQALRTRGAILYKFGHIGISMGDGRSVEARNPSAGVGIFRAADIAWTHGGLVPGLRYR